MKDRLLRSLKQNILYIIPALIVWALSFWTDTKIFSSDGLNMNCLPVDTSMIPFMHISAKICVLIFWLFMFKFLGYCLRNKRILCVFAFFMLVYGAGLVITYPGYYMNDDPIIFAYATRFLPVYWHNYLTSLFYITGMSVFPASCGPVLLSDVCYALVYTYLFNRGMKGAVGKRGAVSAAILIICGILPFTLLGALMCFRPAVYSPFFLLYFLILFFDKKDGKPVSLGRLTGLAFLCGLLSLWRSESIVLLPLSCILIPLVYANAEKQNNAISGNFDKNAGESRKSFGALRLAGAFLLLSTVFYMLLSIPQKMGENKYYGSDYLIISTTRPLSVIVWRDQTYEGADEDIDNISAVTEFGYLHNDSLSCSAYTRYNSDHNEGRYTQTGADEETQKKYIKSAFRLILHNLDLYFGERIQLFCVTNGFFGYDRSMVLNLKPIVSTEFHLYDHDKDYGVEMLNAFLRIPLTYHDDYALFLYKYGGEAFIPVLLLCFILFIISLCRKDWFLFFVFGTLLAREAVIFLTAPTSFIQYSYPTMYTAAALAVLLLTQRFLLPGQGRKGNV